MSTEFPICLPFINYTTKIYNNLNSDPVEILTADNYLLNLNSLIICNISNNVIRVNLCKTIVINNISKTSFLIKEFPIQSYKTDNVKSTVDLISHFNLNVFLPFSTTVNEDTISSSFLTLFTMKQNQIIDCTVDYSELIS